MPEHTTNTPAFITHARKRLKEHPDLDWWAVVIGRALESPFIRDNPALGNLRWLVKSPENAVKVNEGFYLKRKYLGQRTWLEGKRAERKEPHD